MNVSDLMQQMADLGAPMDAIILAVRAIEAKDAELAERRAQAAERKRRERDRKRDSHVTVTRQSQRPPYEDTSTPPVFPVEPNGSTAPRGRADRGSRIPEDWTPPPVAELPPEAQRLASQWPEHAYRSEAEAFRNYWLGETGAKARKLNWNSAWANRIVAVHSRVMRQSGPPRANGPPGTDLDVLMREVERKYGTATQ